MLGSGLGRGPVPQEAEPDSGEQHRAEGRGHAGEQRRGDHAEHQRGAHEGGRGGEHDQHLGVTRAPEAASGPRVRQGRSRARDEPAEDSGHDVARVPGAHPHQHVAHEGEPRDQHDHAPDVARADHPEPGIDRLIRQQRQHDARDHQKSDQHLHVRGREQLAGPVERALRAKQRDHHNRDHGRDHGLAELGQRAHGVGAEARDLRRVARVAAGRGVVPVAQHDEGGARRKEADGEPRIHRLGDQDGERPQERHESKGADAGEVLLSAALLLRDLSLEPDQGSQTQSHQGQEQRSGQLGNRAILQARRACPSHRPARPAGRAAVRTTDDTRVAKPRRRKTWS